MRDQPSFLSCVTAGQLLRHFLADLRDFDKSTSQLVLFIPLQLQIALRRNDRKVPKPGTLDFDTLYSVFFSRFRIFQMTLFLKRLTWELGIGRAQRAHVALLDEKIRN